MENIEPKYLMDETSFYWNPLCPDNRLSCSPEPTPETVGEHLVPVRIFRNDKPVDPSGVLPEDIATNVRRIA